MAQPRTENRPAVANSDIIAVAREQGTRSPFTPSQHRQALDLANRLHRRAISIADAEIAKGKRVAAVKKELT